jgi:hypothetical protein
MNSTPRGLKCSADRLIIDSGELGLVFGEFWPADGGDADD